MKTQLLSKTELRNFGLSGGLIIVVLFGLFLPFILNKPLPFWPWIITSILWTWAFIVPEWLNSIHTIMLKVAHIIGYISKVVVYGFIFYFLIYPTGVLKRLFCPDPISQKKDEKTLTYRTISEKNSKDRMERTF